MEATQPQTTNLFLIEDLENVSRTRTLGPGDLDALRAVADWTKTFVARPNKDLGRPGPICPFVRGAMSIDSCGSTRPACGPARVEDGRNAQPRRGVAPSHVPARLAVGFGRRRLTYSPR